MRWLMAARPGGGGGSDTQTVTVGADGSIIEGDRRRGFISGVIGSISDGTSDLYSGAPITDLYWDENGGGISLYVLTITGASNSGWSQVTIGTKVLYRSSASFATGTWTWTSSDTVSNQAFGTAGGTKTATFA